MTGYNVGKSYKNDAVQIKHLCQLNTLLRTEDVKKILEVSQVLPLISELEGCDVFIDCLTSDQKKAIVVAQNNEFNYIHDEDLTGRYMYPANEPGVMKTLETGTPSRRMKALVKNGLQIEQNTIPIKNDQQQVIGVLILERPVLQKTLKKSDKESQSAAAKSTISDLHNVATHLPVGMIEFTLAGKVTYANQFAKGLYESLHYLEDLKQLSFENIRLNKVTIDEIVCEKVIKCQGLELSDHSLTVTYLYNGPETKSIVMIIEEVTELVQLTQTNHELQERLITSHHQFKTHLQVIDQRLRLRSRNQPSLKLTEASQQISQLIQSVANLHETFCHNQTAEVDLKILLRKIAKQVNSYSVNRDRHIELMVYGDNLMVSSRVALNLSIVMIELISNALLHGYPTKNFGKIKCHITQGQPRATLLIEDDGCGFKLKSHYSRKSGLGIVQQLVNESLRGQLQVQPTNDGTKVKLKFLTTID